MVLVGGSAFSPEIGRFGGHCIALSNALKSAQVKAWHWVITANCGDPQAMVIRLWYQPQKSKPE